MNARCCVGRKLATGEIRQESGRVGEPQSRMLRYLPGDRMSFARNGRRAVLGGPGTARPVAQSSRDASER